MLRDLWDDEIVEHWSLYNLESTLLIYSGLVSIFLLIFYNYFFIWFFCFVLFRYIKNNKLHRKEIKKMNNILYIV